jgi:hypothetical protein
VYPKGYALPSVRLCGEPYLCSSVFYLWLNLFSYLRSSAVKILLLFIKTPHLPQKLHFNAVDIPPARATLIKELLFYILAPQRTPPLTDSPPNLTRSRGGQPGNLNAATHGFYSRQLQPTDLDDLDQAQFASLDQEIELLRISIRRLVEMGSETQTIGESADRLRAVCLAMQTLNSLVRTQHFLVTHRKDFR